MALFIANRTMKMNYKKKTNQLHFASNGEFAKNKKKLKREHGKKFTINGRSIQYKYTLNGISVGNL